MALLPAVPLLAAWAAYVFRNDGENAGYWRNFRRLLRVLAERVAK